jgi:hypothetical protein
MLRLACGVLEDGNEIVMNRDEEVFIVWQGLDALRTLV